MDSKLKRLILNATGATDLRLAECIQRLWSGYGSLDRYRLTGAPMATVVVKHVQFPMGATHPRGWNTSTAAERKRRSYQVETNWYQTWASRCDDTCRVPKCLAVEHWDDEVVMVMEDLHGAGFPNVGNHADDDTALQVICWLANFHAEFLGEIPSGLWSTGTYWHLETRPDELQAMPEGALKQAAPHIDRLLREAPFQTLVHGDAKLANFCLSDTPTRVAAVDFQYVGGGCGVKDVAYFVSSYFDEDDCERYEQRLLDHYFGALGEALKRRGSSVRGDTAESAWRPLYRLAWTDFYRFLQGWSPGHWKIHRYSKHVAEQVVRSLAL